MLVSRAARMADCLASRLEKVKFQLTAKLHGYAVHNEDEPLLVLSRMTPFKSSML